MLRSKNNLLESLVFLIQKALFLKNFEITSFKIRINELKTKLEQTIQKTLLKNSNTT